MSLGDFSTIRKDDALLAKSCFLNLPAELRNRIYEYATPEVFLGASNGAKLTTPSPLCRVSRQIRREFYPFYSSADIVTYVQDFNFDHIYTFLSRLSLSEIQSTSTCISGTRNRQQRGLTIILSFTKVCGIPPSHPVFNLCTLLHWVRRTQPPSGTEAAGIEISYIVSENTEADTEQVVWRIKGESARVNDDRAVAEMGKIVAALKERNDSIRKEKYGDEMAEKVTRLFSSLGEL